MPKNQWGRLLCENAAVTTPPYAEELDVRSVEECFFYHSMDLPGIGSVSGMWDLRHRLDSYLGGIGLAGKRVLDVGTASGFLCFEMEKHGAEVVGFDLEDGAAWDIVPLGGRPDSKFVALQHENVKRLHRSWWLARRAYGSRARVMYGNVYDVPGALGRFDIAVAGCLLLHLRDPFRALESVSRLTDEKPGCSRRRPGFARGGKRGFQAAPTRAAARRYAGCDVVHAIPGAKG